MRPFDSFEKPSFYPQSSQDTALKSPERRINQTLPYTPTRFSRKPTDRVSELKNSINDCIQEFSNKRETNRQAVQQVKKLNQQALETLSTQGSEKAYKTSRKANQEYRTPQYNTDYAPRLDPRQQKQRQNVTLSSFHLNPAQNAYRHSNFHASEIIYRPQSVISNHTELDEIRQKIRSQRLENEQLQRQIEILRRQQQQLTSVGASYGSGESSFMLNENARLRQELGRMESQQNLNAIFQQFQRIKEDNQRLRKETISMLKNVKY